MGKASRLPFFFCLFLSVFLARGLSSAELPPLNTSESLRSEQSSSTEKSPTLDDLLQTLSDEAIAQFEDSKKLLLQLEASQTEAEGLSFSLTQLKVQYEKLESALGNEREAATQKILSEEKKKREAEKSRDRWQVAGITGIALAALEALALGLIISLN